MEHLVTMETPSQAAPGHPGQPLESGFQEPLLLHRNPPSPPSSLRLLPSSCLKTNPTRPARGFLLHQALAPCVPPPCSSLSRGTCHPLREHRAPAPAPTHPPRGDRLLPAVPARDPVLSTYSRDKVPPPRPPGPPVLASRAPRASLLSPGKPAPSEGGVRVDERNLGLRIKELKCPQDLHLLIHPQPQHQGLQPELASQASTRSWVTSLPRDRLTHRPPVRFNQSQDLSGAAPGCEGGV